MVYPINLSNGDSLFDLSPGITDTTTTSLTLLGQGVSNYGEGIAENFVHLLENFANDSAPSNPLTGQLWFDTVNDVLKVWDGTSFIGATGLSSGSAVPGSCGRSGDLFFDTTEKRLYICDGTNYVSVSGPSISGSNTGTTVIQSNGNYIHLIIVNGLVIGAWSSVAFSPNHSGSISVGTDTVNVNLATSFPNGVSVGLTLSSAPNIEFNGKATSAEYSDLAERYKADQKLDPGDVVKLGGKFEITKTGTYKDPDVFGVISTEPGFKMNSAAGDSTTHPYVALSGRVPCKVRGHAKRGDRLVSSSVAGVAESISNREDTDFYVIFGRVLQDKTTSDIETVEVVVGVK